VTSLSYYLPFGQPNFGAREIEAAACVLRSGWVGQGPEVEAFEKELVEALGVPYVVTVNSCTSALFLSLLVSGVKPGDEVIVPSLTWCATANAALFLGARPVFADIEPDTLCVSARTVMKKITPRTRAVIPVHFGGWRAPIVEIRAVLPSNVAVIEDAAHALGTKGIAHPASLTCFSFYANKNLSTGDGGAIALHDATLADQLVSLRQNGLPSAWQRYRGKNTPVAQLGTLGYKMAFNDLFASIGRVQLKRQAEFHRLRRAIADLYLTRLPDEWAPANYTFDADHALHLFLVLVPSNRDGIVRKLRERNVGAAIHYAPLHLMPLYGSQPALPMTEEMASRILTLPISASMTIEDAEAVMDVVEEIK